MVYSHTPIRTVGQAWRQAGRLVDFYLCIQYRGDSGEWFDHFSIDCNHGHAHAHRYIRGKRDGQVPESIFVLNTAADVQTALGLSIVRFITEVTTLGLEIGGER